MPTNQILHSRVQILYWASSTDEARPVSAWNVGLVVVGGAYISKVDAADRFVWPVRGGQ